MFHSNTNQMSLRSYHPADISGLNIKVSTREICDYYGQNYDNIRHMKKFIKQLKNRYKNDEQ